MPERRWRGPASPLRVGARPWRWLTSLAWRTRFTFCDHKPIAPGRHGVPDEVEPQMNADGDRHFEGLVPVGPFEIFRPICVHLRSSAVKSYRSSVSPW